MAPNISRGQLTHAYLQDPPAPSDYASCSDAMRRVPSTLRWPSRTTRLAAAIIAIVGLSVYDLLMTLAHAARATLIESNPLARAVIESGSPALLVIWKLTTVGASVWIFVKVRRRWTAEIGAILCCAILIWLAIRWVRYDRAVEQIHHTDWACVSVENCFLNSALEYASLPARTRDIDPDQAIPSPIADNSSPRIASEVPAFDGCAADFDHDGYVSGHDFDAFVEAFKAGELPADFDHDGVVIGPDFDAFLSAFQEGC